MCFVIDPNAAKPQQTEVFKIVRRTNRGWVSPYVAKSQALQYPKGQVVKKKKGARNKRLSLDGHTLKAQAGIYVYLTEQAARLELNSFTAGEGTHKIIKLQVSPKDFLYRQAPFFSGREAAKATYRQVTVLGVA